MLASGAGTRAFMIDAGDWTDGRFRIHQLTVTSMAAEAATLRHFAKWIHSDNILVSYNGKCDDSALLATRFRLASQPSPLVGLGHIDLLHPDRRSKFRWRCAVGRGD